jgi:cyclic pyranopterin phosphate synthase
MLKDNFNRHVNYLRVSVTDRCDFRCQYCMHEDITFFPKSEMLSLEELSRLANIFIELGIKKIRLTGGEPLIRKNIDSLITELGSNKNLDELTITTNGSQLHKKIPVLKAAGVKRINVSLDSLSADTFEKITRGGSLKQIISNIALAKESGIKLKINTVIMKGVNDHEVFDLVQYSIDNNFDISFIEQMPLGVIGFDRQSSYLSNNELIKTIKKSFSIVESTYKTGGPANYYSLVNYKTRIGFISPHSHNFCDTCNRVRLSAKGELFLCLGHEDKIDLLTPIRRSESDENIKKIILDSMQKKPKSHLFDLKKKENVVRFMSHTGG